MTQATFVTPETSTRRDPKLNTSSEAWPIHQYFGTYHDTSGGPQAFHTQREPNRESRAHFHHVDQYQVFFGAPDTSFQRHLTGPLLVHYSDADTLYGPFSSGDEPFSFMTLRAKGNDFKGYMPEDKDAMSHGRPKRHYHHELEEWLAEPLPTGEAVEEPLIEAHEDGLAAFRAAVPAGAKYTAPSAAGTGGQYLVVVEGEFYRGEERLPRFTMGWVAPGDGVPELVAGEEGGRLVVLRFGEANAA